MVSCGYLRTVGFVDIIKLLDCRFKLSFIYLIFIRSGFVLTIVSSHFTRNGRFRSLTVFSFFCPFLQAVISCVLRWFRRHVQSVCLQS